MDDRRRTPGTIGHLWCRQCRNKLVVAGRRSPPGDGPRVEMIVCPHCRTMRRMVMPPEVGAPFRVVPEGEPLRAE